jgi:hypothetical protein
MAAANPKKRAKKATGVDPKVIEEDFPKHHIDSF